MLDISKEYDKEFIRKYCKDLSELIVFKLNKVENKEEFLIDYLERVYEAGFKDGYDKTMLDMKCLDKMPNFNIFK